MQPIKINEFLEDVLLYIKFPFAKEDIRLELENHILDKISDYMAQGYSQEKAQQQAIEEMGDSKEIGMELNKQHNPFLGWVLGITNVMVVCFLIACVWFGGIAFISSLFNGNMVKEIPKENRVYHIKIDERVQIDDTVIHFTNVIYEKNGDMNIFYEYYDTRLWGTGWSLGGIGEVRDNLGNTYFPGSGSVNGGVRSRGRRTISNFSKDADLLIIDYDYYNRQYRVEIPLQVGDTDE